MMYKTFALISAALCMANSAPCVAVQTTAVSLFVADTSTGIIHHGKERLDSLTGIGRVTLDDTQIVGHLEVNGSLYAKDAHIGSVNVNGQATFVGAIVDGRCDVGGSLNASKSSFRDEINVTAQKITFQDCNIHSIHVRNTDWPFGSQVVDLSKCNLRGNITFDSEKGLVIVRNGCQFHGKVIGGQIKKK